LPRKTARPRCDERRLFAPTEWRAIFTNRQVNPYL
jgi:hypothetical protein